MPGAIRVSFTLEAENFRGALNRYLAAVQNGKNRSDLVKAQMRLMIRGILDLTPPETLAQGRAAVHRDILLAMSPWGGEDGQFTGIKDDGLRERLIGYQRAGQYEKLKEVWAKLGAKSALRLVDFSEDLHHRVQDARGHVNTDQKIMVPQLRAWKSYVRKVQVEVGRARGGWVRSADLVGLAVPGWVSRHSDGGDASVLIEPGTATFTFINRSVFIPRYRQNIELAIGGRIKAMETDARRFLAGAKTFAGFP